MLNILKKRSWNKKTKIISRSRQDSHAAQNLDGLKWRNSQKYVAKKRNLFRFLMHLSNQTSHCPERINWRFMLWKVAVQKRKLWIFNDWGRSLMLPRKQIKWSGEYPSLERKKKTSIEASLSFGRNLYPKSRSEEKKMLIISSQVSPTSQLPDK